MPAGAAESRRKSGARGGRNVAVLIAKGLAVAIPMFGLFAAHAFLSEATYETSAKLTLKPVPGQESKVPAPLLLLRELQDAALDEQTLDRLASDRAGKGAPASKRAEVAHAIRKEFAIDTKDGRTYAISFRDSDPNRAEAVCNLLAGRALAQATRPMGPEPKAVPSERQRRISELLAFLSRHPELATFVPGQAAPTENESVVSALLAEKVQIEAALRRIRAQPSDNPYAEVDPLAADPGALERRLADIDMIVANRKKAQGEREGNKPKVDPAVEAELMQKFRAVNQAPADPPPTLPKPRFTASFEKAEVPDSPLKPDRPRVLLVGTLVGLAGGIIFVIGRAKVAVPRKSRTPSSPSSKSNPAGQRRSAQHAETMPLPTPSLAGVMADGAPLPVLPQGMIANPWAVTLPTAPSTTTARSSEPPCPPAEADARWSSFSYEPGVPARHRAVLVPETKDRESMRPIVDVEAVTIDSGRVTDNSTGAMAEEVKRPGRKVTQILGSPPSVPGARQPLRSNDGGTIPLPNTGYSYVNTARVSEVPRPPQQTAAPVPQPVPPVSPAHAEQPAAAAQPNQHPERPQQASRSSAPPSGRMLVTPLRPPLGWRPEQSLSASNRQALAQEILQVQTQGCLVVGVTGASIDLKARVAAELAMALALYRRILLLEADFQVPTLHQWMRLEMSIATGYSHQLRVRVHDGQGDGRFRVVECGPSLHVLGEGVMRSPGMILSREFEDSVMNLRAFYDFIVVNGPPTSATVDLQALAGVADGIVLVGQRAPKVPLVFRAKRMFTPVES